MTPPGTKDPAAQGAAAKSQPATAPGGVVQPCNSCTVTITPSPVNLCNTKTAKQIAAKGDPSGGSFSWSSDDTDTATVSGSGRKASVKGVKPGRTKIKVTYSVSGCTCTDEIEARVCTCTSGFFYAFAGKRTDNIVGVRAKIKTRWGKLCCEDEGCNREHAGYAAYANVSNQSGGLTWAQTGYVKQRDEGSTTAAEFRYAEMQGFLYHVTFDPANAPAEGSVHLYQCVLDGSRAKWTFTEDGVDWQTFADYKWANTTGNAISYSGELHNKENDMPGTEPDKCEFTECQFLEKRGDPTEETTPSEVLSNFDFDESTAKPEHQAQIDAVAETVAESWQTPPEIIKIRLVGHTDTVGSPGYNIGLGQRRALAVRTAMVNALEAQQSGLSGKVKLVTESKGESQPIDLSGTPAGDAKNRRVEIFLTTRAPVPDWQDAGLAKSDVRTADAGEWGAEWVSGTAFNIWDKQPLP